MLSNNGAVYVYRDRGQGHWIEEDFLAPEGMGVNINVARSLDLGGDFLAAGSLRSNPFVGSGSAPSST